MCLWRALHSDAPCLKKVWWHVWFISIWEHIDTLSYCWEKDSSSWVVAFQECSTLPPSFCIVCITCVEVTAELIGEKVSYTQNQIILDPGSAWNKVTIPKALLWQHILETRQFVSASIWFRLVYWRLLLQWLLVKSNQKQIMLQMETIKLLDRSKKKLFWSWMHSFLIIISISFIWQ